VPELVLTDAKIFAGGYDLSGDHNQVSLGISIEEKDFTRFGAQGKSRRAGLGEMSLNGEGFTNHGTDLQDEVHFNDLGVYQRIMTVAATADVGQRAFSFRGVEMEYTPVDAAVGDEHGFSVAAMSSGLYLPSAYLLHGVTAETSSGTETGVQVGAIASGELAYAALHVFDVTGTSIDVTVESDSSAGFGSASTQVTFAQATGPTSEWSSAVAGPVTDDWWRVAWTLVGTSATFAVVFGIK
jgi:hypothetical protein